MAEAPGNNSPRTRRVIQVVGLLAVLAICVAAVSAAYSLRESTRREWSGQMSSLSLILAEQASQTLFSAHTVLDSFSDVLAQAKLTDESSYRRFVSTLASHRLLIDKTEANPVIDVATFVSHEGQVLNFTRAFPAPQIDVSDRDYFRAHRADSTIDTFTSTPVRNKGNGKWVFYLSRRVNDSQGNMLGLVLVGVSVESFSRFYEKIGNNLGRGASVALHRSDFTLMARWPLVDDLVGQQNFTSATYNVVVNSKRLHDVVITDSPRLSEGNSTDSRMVAPRVLDRYPFIVSPVITEELYLRHWRSSLFWIFSAAAFSVLMVLLGMRWLLRANSKVQEELTERNQAQASLRAAHEMLETRVQERTAELTKEVAERRAAQEALAAVNAHIASVSHRAGMAEVANSVLHNVGNVLNSVNVSVLVLSERLRRTPMEDFPQAAALLQTNSHRLHAYLNDDQQGRQLPSYFDLLSRQWLAEHELMVTETEQLKHSVQHIKDIVSRQQSLSGYSGIEETMLVSDVIHDALSIHTGALQRAGIHVTRTDDPGMTWHGDRSKLGQILLNLVVNAEESLLMSDANPRELSIDSRLTPQGEFSIRVVDNGIGMTPQAHAQVFSYGFTTKRHGHGFGLHASALAAQELGGALEAFSAGHNQGAIFILTLRSSVSSTMGQI
jgi:signal transduction histidine kinase